MTQYQSNKIKRDPEFDHPYLFGLTKMIFRITQGYIVLQMVLQNVKRILIYVALNGVWVTVLTN